MKNYVGSMRMSLLFRALFVIALAAAPVPLFAQDADDEVNAGDITRVDLHHADSMSLSQRAGEPQVLKGNVDLTLLDDANRGTRIKGQKITIFYDADSGVADRIVAEGAVSIKRNDMNATTELMIYDRRQETVDMLEDNLVRDPRGELTADRIRLHLRTDKVAAEGNVRGIVYPDQTASGADAGNG